MAQGIKLFEANNGHILPPRFLAMLIMLPVLTVFGDYVGMFGGWTVCHFALDMNTASYVLRSDTGAALLIDFGLDMIVNLPTGDDRSSRRPWLPSLGPLRRDFGVDRVAFEHRGRGGHHRGQRRAVAHRRVAGVREHPGRRVDSTGGARFRRGMVRRDDRVLRVEASHGTRELIRIDRLTHTKPAHA